MSASPAGWGCGAVDGSRRVPHQPMFRTSPSSQTGPLGFDSPGDAPRALVLTFRMSLMSQLRPSGHHGGPHRLRFPIAT